MQRIIHSFPTPWTGSPRAGHFPVAVLGLLLGLALGLLAGCAPEEPVMEVPPPLDPDLIQRFRAGVGAGYEALEADSLEAAVGHFDRLAARVLPQFDALTI